MARMYKVSADTSEKEKAVGGIMTFGQAGWLVLGFLIFAGLFLLLANIKMPVVLAVILSLPPGAVFGCVFAFYKKGGLPLATYLLYQHSFKQKSKVMVNDMVYGKTFAKEDELFI